MKTLILAASASIALASFSEAATAGCSAPASTPINTVSALTTLLSGKTVCVPDATPASWKWQEYHQAGGDLVDYKKGPSDTIDPSEKVGTWAVSGNTNGQRARVTHDYGTGGKYTYTVFDNGGAKYSFCGGGQDIVSTIKAGQGACP